jgi:1-acyl-sn-glycerol-3-phosphate acyltransferase
MRLILRLCFRLKGYGQENVPASGGLIICPNHASHLDPPVVGTMLYHRMLWFMGRDTLFSNPVFGAIIRRLHTIPIKRGSVDRGAYQAFEEAVAAGHAVLIFPEGTRSPDGNLQAPKAGSGMMVYRCAGAKVVPVRIFGSAEAMPKGRLPRFSPIRVVYGPALDFSAERALPAERETYELIASRIMQAIAALQDPAETP